MSHFVVWVVGPDVEKQLAPYDENTPVAPYRRYEEGAELERMKEHYGTTDLQELAAKMPDWNGVKGGVDENGLYGLSTYNPQSKWDWYEIGGRWLGSLIVRQGAQVGIGRPGVFDNKPARNGGVDIACKGDIDFPAMEKEARAEAEEYFIQLETATRTLPLARTWKECREAYPDIEEARQQYGSQPAVKAIREHRLDAWNADAVADLRQGRQAYVDRCAHNSWVPRVLVQDGQWHEVGRMGWWGIHSDEPEEFDPWAAEVRSVVLNLPDDTLITVVDCHI